MTYDEWKQQTPPQFEGDANEEQDRLNELIDNVDEEINWFLDNTNKNILMISYIKDIHPITLRDFCTERGIKLEIEPIGSYLTTTITIDNFNKIELSSTPVEISYTWKVKK